MSEQNDSSTSSQIEAKADVLLKLITQGEDDVRKGNVRPQEEVFRRIAEALRP